MPRRTVSTVVALVTAGLVVAAPGPQSAPPEVGVWVVVGPDGSAAAAAAVTRAGGRVLAALPLAGGVAASLPAGTALPPGYVAAADRPLTVAGLSAAPAGPGGTIRATLGLPPSGTEGAGVTVAVVDTGIADVPDLRGAVVDRVDVTGTGGGDGYGHGTFMAGLVAGRETGVAPGARLVDVKVADAAGTTSLVRVLRGLEEVAARPSIDVVNLSLSSDSPLPWQIDPLTRALGALWRRGVTVVVPAGNDGPDARTVGSPGGDPTLLTVGGLDEAGTAARRDDTVPAWSSRGPAPQRVAKPDLAAPGTSVVSVRAPGSVLEAAYPSAAVGDAWFRGSGTSMATAVASAAAAVLLGARPGLTPDEVKWALVSSAYGARGLADRDAAGAGGLDLAAALSAPVADAAAVAALVRGWSEGGTSGVPARGVGPAARAWAGAAWERANSWSDADWQARAWAARGWAGDGWAARAWAARAWAGEDWAGRAWAARAWALWSG